MYKVRINATFDSLPAAHAQLSATGEATTKKAAAGAALRNLINSPELKGKRYETFSATIIFLGNDHMDEQEND